MSGTPLTVTVPEVPVRAISLDSEWSLLLAACSEDIRTNESERIRSLCGSVRWKVLFDLADRHGIQPLLCRALSKAEDAVPPAEMRVLKQLYETNLHKSLFLSRELIRITDHLSEDGIEVMPYKGVALAETLYGDMALRKAGDIDLLVHQQDFQRVRESVRELGYAPQKPLSPSEERVYLKTGYECVFDGAAGRNLLEVQWAIQPRFYAVDFESDSMFQRAKPVAIAGHEMKTPAAEDLFIVLALHAAKHVWGRLIWLCDLAHIMRMPSLDWNWIATQARELGIGRILRITTLLANRLLGVDIPSAAEAGIPFDAAALVLTGEIEKHIMSAQAYDVESLAYFRLMLRLRENRSDRARFLARLVLTPGPGEWALIRLPGPLFPLYRAVRLCRLAGKLVRR